MTIDYIKGATNSDEYRINQLIPNIGNVAVFATDSTFTDFYALRFPAFAEADYVRDGQLVVKLYIPLTVQILSNLFTGSQLYCLTCQESDLPSDIPLRPYVITNGFVPQTILDVLIAKFTNPVVS
jgi:hypothetical protein